MTIMQWLNVWRILNSPTCVHSSSFILHSYRGLAKHWKQTICHYDDHLCHFFHAFSQCVYVCVCEFSLFLWECIAFILHLQVVRLNVCNINKYIKQKKLTSLPLPLLLPFQVSLPSSSSLWRISSSIHMIQPSRIVSILDHEVLQQYFLLGMA